MISRVLRVSLVQAFYIYTDLTFDPDNLCDRSDFDPDYRDAFTNTFFVDLKASTSKMIFLQDPRKVSYRNGA
jgi:hypothetical protein